MNDIAPVAGIDGRHDTGLEIAVIGMAGRFPGAATLDAFWRNLVDGRESIGPLDDARLRAEGVDAATLADPQYRKVGAVLDGVDQFDAGFFGYSPREAEILDPQQRLFLECAWEALETAGCDARRYRGSVGVFGGAGMNGYLFNLVGNPRTRETVSPYELFIANDKDFLTTRVSYKLGLTGPSIDVQTACSSSLVAVHLACQSLLGGDCDMALAGGVAVSRQIGYRVQDGGIYSPDGHCRAFDARAAGTVAGNGVGIVVLKRLADALADGDSIDAVIKGSAINNDGAAKVSYTAPSVDAQAAVIQAALAMAAVSADSISYIEAHGTGTRLGDPIEVAALTRAFGAQGVRRGFCAIGSVKTNIGHLDAAAGIASLIKTVLALKHRQLPASLHFEQPNPQIDFAASPFRVNATLAEWTTPLRRAGVSSFGIGGTNAHVIVEQAPMPAARVAGTGPELLVLSARSPAALRQAAGRLADHLDATPGIALADVAHTLQSGRREFEHRAALVVDTAETASRRLRADPWPIRSTAAAAPSPVWLFTGQGSQYPAMARALYRQQPVFRAALDHCATLLGDQIDGGLINLLCDEAAAGLDETARTQPALFAFEYALAQWWKSLAGLPRAMLGHSLGEYVAACVADVFDLETALRLVALRGRLMQAMPRGAMLAVNAAPDALAPWLRHDIEIAAVNAPAMVVVAGSAAAVEALGTDLGAAGMACRPLRTSHGFHSMSMQAAADQFAAALDGVRFQSPKMPFVSNVTGTWITDDEAVDPRYWARQLRAPVQFADGVRTLLQLPDPMFLEIGPGHVLAGLVRQQRHADGSAPRVVHSVPAAADDAAHGTALLAAAGQWWAWGAPMDWSALQRAADSRRRVPLPSYPFERQRYWVDSGVPSADDAPAHATPAIARADPADWVWAPAWQRRSIPTGTASVAERQNWLLLLDATGVGRALARQIERAGYDVLTVVEATAFAQRDYREFGLDPLRVDQFRELRTALAARELSPTRIVDLRNLDPRPTETEPRHFERLLALVTAWSEVDHDVQISVVTRGACEVLGYETVDPWQAVVHGLCQVTNQEHPQLGCRLIDLPPATDPREPDGALWAELRAADAPPVVAWRGRHRWQLDYHTLSLPPVPARRTAGAPGIRKAGTYVVIGDFTRGLGGIWARALARDPARRLVLIAASVPPAPVPPELIDQCRAGGATLVALEADIDAAGSLRAALDAAAEGGPIDGVFCSTPTTNEHAAAPLSLLQPAHWHYNRRTKIRFLQQLAPAIESHAPAFCCVQASLSSVLGGIGLAPYAAANHWVDAFVAAQAASSAVAWYAVNWDTATGDAADMPSGSHGRGASLAEFALTPDDIWTLTERILALTAPGVVAVSKADLRVRRDQWVHGTPQPRVDSTTRGDGYGRPDLTTAYLAPRNDIERTIADIWQDLLRVDRVGVHDSFFDLGGHSLLAIQAIGRLRQAFPVHLELRELLDGTPTVAGIATLVAAQLPDAGQMDAMAALLAEVQSLSNDDIERQLTE